VKHKDESAADYMRRIARNLDYEEESYLDDLKDIPALVEFFELWSVYGTDLMSGILICIGEGDDPAPLRAFIRKHKLPWRIPPEVLVEHRKAKLSASARKDGAR